MAKPMARAVERTDTIKRLKELRDARAGYPVPDWLQVSNWGLPISELAGAAVALLEASDTIGGRPFTLAGLLCRARLAEAIRQI
jgi:hypothetical protein